jgi:hypothetical protein
MILKFDNKNILGETIGSYMNMTFLLFQVKNIYYRPPDAMPDIKCARSVNDTLFKIHGL